MGFSVSVEESDVQAAEQGNKLLPGWGPMELHDAYDDSKTGKLALEWKFNGGPNEGRRFTELFDDPDASENGDVVKKKLVLRAHRLGIAKAGVDLTTELFMTAIGWTGFGRIDRREYVKNGAKEEAFDLGFGNIYPPGYENPGEPDLKKRRKYPPDFPADWRAANTVDGSAEAAAAGSPELPGMGGETQPAPTTQVAPAGQAADRYADLGL